MGRPERPHEVIRRVLNAGAELTFEKLCEAAGVLSARHMRRILRELREEGFDIQEKRVGRFKVFMIPEEKREVVARPLHLSEDQVLSLLIAAEAALPTLEVSPLGEPLRTAIAGLIDSVAAEVQTFEPGAVRAHWHFGPGQSAPFDPKFFRMISKAIEDCRRIRIDYTTASSGMMAQGRLVDPLTVAVQAGTWMLVAYCHLRRKIIDFALAGISKVEVCNEAFIRPDDYDPELHFRDRFGALSGDKVWTVRILVDPDKAIYFKRKFYHPTQQIEERRQDGVVVSYEVAGLEEIRSFIESWGKAVTVLEPLELAAMVRDDAAAVLASYSGLSVDKASGSRRPEQIVA